MRLQSLSPLSQAVSGYPALATRAQATTRLAQPTSPAAPVFGNDEPSGGFKMDARQRLVQRQQAIKSDFTVLLSQTAKTDRPWVPVWDPTILSSGTFSNLLTMLAQPPAPTAPTAAAPTTPVSAAPVPVTPDTAPHMAAADNPQPIKLLLDLVANGFIVGPVANTSGQGQATVFKVHPFIALAAQAVAPSGKERGVNISNLSHRLPNLTKALAANHMSSVKTGYKLLPPQYPHQGGQYLLWRLGQFLLNETTLSTQPAKDSGNLLMTTATLKADSPYMAALMPWKAAQAAAETK
ncbi:MAG: hypothetical protein KC476_03650 [Cyanobacteria bacterium HKST-UBA06]|nr:hypothetical protein [Cyanobacteria bacterium HKST-UBA06]